MRSPRKAIAMLRGKPALSKRVFVVSQHRVPIVAIPSAEAGVEVFPYRLRMNNPNVEWQEPVQHLRPLGGRHRDRAIEVRDLAGGVGAAVGSARAEDFRFLAGRPANSFCQCALDRSLARLCGPAAKVGAVVRNDELDASRISRQARARRRERRPRAGCQSWSNGYSRRRVA